MLERESWDEGGWQVRISVPGKLQVLRLLPAAFLSLWLGMWFAGERFAGGMLLTAARDAFAPTLWLDWLPRARSVTPAPVVGFLALWVSLWTVGGVFAMSALAGVLFGVPVVRWNDRVVEFALQVGPFSRSRRVDLASLGAMQPGPLGTLVFANSNGGRALAIGPFGEPGDAEQVRAWIEEARASRAAGSEDLRAAA